jgi:hypothetical protein
MKFLFDKPAQRLAYKHAKKTFHHAYFSQKSRLNKPANNYDYL